MAERPFDLAVWLGVGVLLVLVTELVLVSRRMYAQILVAADSGRRGSGGWQSPAGRTRLILYGAIVGAVALTAWLWLQDVAASFIMGRATGCGTLIPPDEERRGYLLGLQALDAASSLATLTAVTLVGLLAVVSAVTVPAWHRGRSGSGSVRGRERVSD